MRETPALPEADATDLLSAGAHGPDRMDAVFARLFSSYGRAFLDQFTAGRTHGGRDVGVELAKSEWRRALAEFEDDSLLRACDQLREACRWPPRWAACASRVRRAPTIKHAMAMVSAALQCNCGECVEPLRSHASR